MRPVEGGPLHLAMLTYYQIGQNASSAAITLVLLINSSRSEHKLSSEVRYNIILAIYHKKLEFRNL
jgi:hypothetical protein